MFLTKAILQIALILLRALVQEVLRVVQTLHVTALAIQQETAISIVNVQSPLYRGTKKGTSVSFFVKF